MSRNIINYNSSISLFINAIRSQVLSQYEIINNINNGSIKDKDIIKRFEKKSIIYPNQEITARNIMKTFLDRQNIMTLCLQDTQTGKTGVMAAIVRLAIETSIDIINPENICIISPLSSLEWKNQTIQRFPDYFKNNIYHRNDLEKFIENISGKENIIMIMVEIQVANLKFQQLYDNFLKANLFHIDYLCENDIKIIQVLHQMGCFMTFKGGIKEIIQLLKVKLVKVMFRLLIYIIEVILNNINHYVYLIKQEVSIQMFIKILKN